MKKFVICEIDESDIGIVQNERAEVEEYTLRKCARGILLKDKSIALLNVTTKRYHKLPGGEIEKGEEIVNGFKREVKEETGWDCDIVSQDGITIEYRNRIKILQISYVFLAKAIGKPARQQLDEGESQVGHELEWIPLEKVEKLLQIGSPTDYEDKFITVRDRSIVRFYKNKLAKLV